MQTNFRENWDALLSIHAVRRRLRSLILINVMAVDCRLNTKTYTVGELRVAYCIKNFPNEIKRNTSLQ